MTQTKVTGVSFIQTPEGMTCAYKYSTIDEEGNVISSNVRGSYIDSSKETEDFLNNLYESIIFRIEKKK